jgi:predicted  nucleic acid-binding Zn-ribbon protein
MDKTMKQFREMKTMINASKMTADAKRDALQGILEAENKLTANIKTLKKQME